MARVYDQLMKSAKFQPAQNKSENGEYVDSISEFILLCEKEGFIPRFYTTEPQDKVDEAILDNRSYVDRVIRDELNLGNLIENALAAMKRQEETEDEEIKSEDDIDEDSDEIDVLNEINEMIEEDIARDADLAEEEE